MVKTQQCMSGTKENEIDENTKKRSKRQSTYFYTKKNNKTNNVENLKKCNKNFIINL